MRIYIDEGGSFIIPNQPSSSFSVVLAFIVPSVYETELFYDFLRLRDRWPKQDTEIKGSSLDERRAAEVIDLLTRYDVVAEFVAMDVGIHTIAAIEQRKKVQADRLVANLTAEHHPEMVRQVETIAANVRRMSNQLFVQAFLTIELLCRVIQVATLYYAQRLPAELGDIAWFIDRKAETITTMEEIWSTLVLPMSESHFARTPLIVLKEGDYSHFDNRYGSALDDKMKKHLEWMAKMYGPRDRSDIHPLTDVRKLLTEQRQFVDSRDFLGIQLADILASILRRALNDRLQRSGWEDFGKLVVGKPKDESHFVTFAVGPDRMSGHSGNVGNVILEKAKSLLHKEPSSEKTR
jgi:Protein of unknown function (DUF3800)